MTTLITTACRRIAAVFGSERAQHKLAQQKSERTAMKLVSCETLHFAKFTDIDKKFPIPRFDSALTGRISPTLNDVTNLLRPACPTVRELALPRQVTGGERSHTTNADAPRRGSWLHDHWKPSPAGIAARSASGDTTDATGAYAASPATREETDRTSTFPGASRNVPLASILREVVTPPRSQRKPAPDTPPPPVPANGRELHPSKLKQLDVHGPFDPMSRLNHQATALINAEQDIATMFGELGPSIASQQVSFSIPRPQCVPEIPAPDYESDGASDSGEEWEELTPTELAAAEARFSKEDEQIAEFEARVAAKPPLPARSAKVVAHQGNVRASSRTHEAEISVTAQRRPAVDQVDAGPRLVAQSSNAPAPPAPPAPPPAPERTMAHGHPAPGVLLAALKNHALVKSRSLEERAIESFGTGTKRASDAPAGTSADADRQRVGPSKRIERPSLPSDLLNAIARRRVLLGETPEKAPVASARPTAIQPPREPAVSAGTPAKPKGEVFGGPKISQALKLDMVAELQAKLALRAK